MLPYSEQGEFGKNAPAKHPADELDQFFKEAYHDMRFVLKTITKHKANSYIYFGDIQKNLFYISDNLRDEFGFESNVVPDFAAEWAKRIYRENGVEKYWHNFQYLYENHESVHDLRYQVRNKDGEVLWIRCCGEVQWNEDKTVPLFFAGRITKQDDSFVVDPITNFPSGSAVLNHLSEIQERGKSCYAVGFCYNNISKMNTMLGRNTVDEMIHDISLKLMDELFDQVSFYRLAGIRCAAVVDKESGLKKNDLIRRIQEIVKKHYEQCGVVVPDPCAFAYMPLPQKDMSPADIREKLVSLIKMARLNKGKPYIEDSKENTRKIYEMSNMEMAICQDVTNGMKNFRPVVQPVVSAETGKVLSGEILMRWKFEGKDVSPEIFIPILEKTNMIHEAGRWILGKAVEVCSKIQMKVPEFYLTVNVSLQQLYDQEFLTFIRKKLDEHCLAGSHIVLEMTERCMDSDPKKLLALMEECRKIGIRFALDDFGTGYSSLRVLMHYPTDIIKLDRTLLMEMLESEDKMNFIFSIVFACHRFEKTVCMEGVETKKQAELVKDTCCDMIQGFYYYKPAEIDKLYDMIL